MKNIKQLLVAFLVIVLLHSCKKDGSLVITSDKSNTVSADILSRIQAHGFSTANVIVQDDGYLVEGDILLTNDFLNTIPSGKFLQVAKEEQYHTTQLVTNLPRVITLLVSTNLSTAFVQATDLAIARYNNLGLQITFARITSGTADITITGASTPPSGGNITYAKSGFPLSNGNPYNVITVNTQRLALGTNPNATFAGSIIQHEIGHCIGFRHTDYMNRSYSCGGSVVNEGVQTVGAVYIDGTPVGPDPNSWMLACQPSNTDRTFNANDVIAVNALYK